MQKGVKEGLSRKEMNKSEIKIEQWFGIFS